MPSERVEETFLVIHPGHRFEDLVDLDPIAQDRHRRQRFAGGEPLDGGSDVPLGREPFFIPRISRLTLGSEKESIGHGVEVGGVAVLGDLLLVAVGQPVGRELQERSGSRYRLWPSAEPTVSSSDLSWRAVMALTTSYSSSPARETAHGVRRG